MLLAAGCGGGGGDPVEEGPVSYGSGDEVPLETTTTAGPRDAAPSTTARGSKSGPTSTAKPSGAGPSESGPSAADPSPGPTTAGGSPTTTTSSQSNLGKGATGSFARYLLRPAPARKIVIEFLYQPGKELGTRARTHLTQVLADVSKKSVETPAIELPGGGDDVHSAAEVIKMADQYGKAIQGDDQAVIRFLILRGRSDKPNTLGFAIRGDVLAIFPDELTKAQSPVVDRATLEDAVTMHEVGHILGLVDLARNTGREDKAHPGHSSNRESVMFWAVESSLVGQVLGGPPPTNFDKDDLADLVALREGA